jgi:hypothetical protein
MSNKKFQPLAEFVRENSITEIVKNINVNKNGYSFVTFIDKDNKAMNVYFGSSIASNYKLNQPVTKELLAELQIYAYITEDGEPRLRLVNKGADNRVAIADLL